MSLFFRKSLFRAGGGRFFSQRSPDVRFFASASANAAPATPSEDGTSPGMAKQRGTGDPYDVLIIGGGVTGSALLYELSAFTSTRVGERSYLFYRTSLGCEFAPLRRVGRERRRCSFRSSEAGLGGTKEWFGSRTEPSKKQLSDHSLRRH